LRVGLDYQPAVTHWPGVGRYARELVRALVQLDACPELRLLELGGEARTIGEPALGLAGCRARVRRRRVRLPRRLLTWSGVGADTLLGGVDLYQAVHPWGPRVARAARVLAVSELPAEGTEAEARLRARLVGFDHLLVFSRHGARELERRVQVAPERVHVVPVGCDHWRRALPEPPPRAAPAELLVLGALRRERAPERVLAAFERLHAEGAAGRLVLAGGRGDGAERFLDRLRTSPARGAVEWIERPREEELPARVARASALVHLSPGELSAVTPLEALSFGTPAVTLAGGAFEEILGDVAVAVDAERAADPDALAAAVARALETARSEQAAAERVALASRFTWLANARATVDVWRACLERARGGDGAGTARAQST